MKTFLGYPRKYGPAGIRNLALVISGELSCNPWAREITSYFDNCWAVTHKHGTGNFTRDRKLFIRLLSGITVHPNVAGFVIISSGPDFNFGRRYKYKCSMFL